MGGEVKPRAGGKAVQDVRFKEIRTAVLGTKGGDEWELFGLTEDGKVFRYQSGMKGGTEGWRPLSMVTSYVG